MRSKVTTCAWSAVSGHFPVAADMPPSVVQPEVVLGSRGHAVRQGRMPTFHGAYQSIQHWQMQAGPGWARVREAGLDGGTLQ